MALQPSRGEVWTANLNPIRGHEQAGERPVLIVSTNGFNHGPSDLVIIVPITRTDRRIPMHIAISPPEGGLSTQSYLLCDGVRAIARERLGPRAWGIVSPETMAQVADRLRILLDL